LSLMMHNSKKLKNKIWLFSAQLYGFWWN